MGVTRAVINLNNLRHNIRIVKQELGQEVKLCMAVKANAYGHGAGRVSALAKEEGIDFLGVATTQEGSELKAAGIDLPVIVLGLPFPEEVPKIVENNLAILVAGENDLRFLAAEAQKRGRKVAVHVKIDTGMGRIGCRPDQAPGLALLVERSEHLILAGICTHFPVSDIEDSNFTDRQVGLFKECVEAIRSSGLDPGLVHAANSGAVVGYRDAYFNMVRVGILLYGYYPSAHQKRRLPVKPVMSLMTKVVFLKRVKKGTGLSYGLTYTTSEDTVIATLPVGYADGYNRLLSNRAEVVIRGRRYPVVGTICMDQCLVDLGPDSDVELYDDVILFGNEPGCPDAEEIASLLGTIPYEVTCLVGRRVPRVYVDRMYVEKEWRRSGSSGKIHC